MRRFEERVAIVTGGASGIGLACALRLAAEGARIVIAARGLERSEAILPRLIEAGAPDAMAQDCDVSREDRIDACCEATLARFGRLDVVVNNAGVMDFKPLDALTAADWNRVLAVDLVGAGLFVGHALRRMKPGGAVVNVASVHAVMTTPDVAPYAAAKAAMLSLTRSGAIEGKARGIRVNAVLPGAIDTPMLWENPNVKSGVETIAKEDVGRPEDVAAAVAYLASEDAAFITGAALAVDGGRLAQL